MTTPITETNLRSRQRPATTGNRHSKKWVPYLGALVLAGLLVAGLWPQPVPVEMGRVTAGSMRVTVNEEGKTRVKQRYMVSAPVAGQLRRILFKAGAEVRADETVLAVIDPLSPTLLDARSRSLAEARRDTAAANLEKARVAHSFAASELTRFEKLYKQQTVSAQERETAQLRESSAAKDLTAAESALRQAEAELAEFGLVPSDGVSTGRPPVEVKSPTSGRVLRVFEENSRAVSPGMPLLEVGDPADLEVVVDVLSRDGAMIQPGAHVEFEQWGGKTPLVGRVRLVEPAGFTKVSALGVEEQRVNVVADLVTPPQERPGVGDNFRVEARITVWEAERALKVPLGALFRHGGIWSVFVVEDGRARMRKVEVGRTGGAEAQVLSGLKEGDDVILYPGSRVEEGDRVKRIQI